MARACITATCDWIFEQSDIWAIYAFVDTDNMASIKTRLAVGFIEIGLGAPKLRLKLPIDYIPTCFRDGTLDRTRGRSLTCSAAK
jgi:hypothetical protein